ncbi:hypothetical protein BCR33DRAFT_666627, partial [Rhizoclosmatium globosum]
DSLSPLPNSWVSPVGPVTPVDDRLFLDIVNEVRLAIKDGVYPERIQKGSSGSYFCKNRDGKIVGVFKPKNEEPYGTMNPKWTKWFQKTCLPCCFGRSCLVNGAGYLSEACASYIDRRLGLGVVPRTEVVLLASPTFFYTWYEKWLYVRGIRPLPLKVGSFQLFLNGFKDATTFFKDGYDAALQTTNAPPSESTLLRSDSDVSLSSPAHPCNWSPKTQLEFQAGFERLVVLDYLIRNTDRGMDNWMIQYRETTPSPLEPSSSSTTLQIDTDPDQHQPPTPSDTSSIHVAAIDNGLAFPFKHPDRWRAYPYGWSYLPIARVPFSKSTRELVLYSLTSQDWWTETMRGVERIMRIDDAFEEAVWRRQKGVMRGEGYNLAEVLRRSAVSGGNAGIAGGGGEGWSGSPWELVRRPVVAVYEEVEESDEEEGDGWTDRSALIGAGILGGRGDGEERRGGVLEGMRRFRRRVRQRFETFTRSQPFFQHF